MRAKSSKQRCPALCMIFRIEVLLNKLHRRIIWQSTLQVGGNATRKYVNTREVDTRKTLYRYLYRHNSSKNFLNYLFISEIFS